ncbi:dentin sialophosphoprotein-like [Dunckerocampus dactyliophorus]|uniref:dentin sialophosphoprotein-like n=1 Tax=Dunckerocampus dactyliophorus TaxID=161453 RepID=UPI00240713F1|nr:dentin sialophosphoprotein-like [Dunckerocampus dactyliophorus]
MANLSSGCSSSVLENQDVDKNWENIPPGLPASYTQYLDSEYFPDITLVDVTRDFEIQQSMNDLSALKSIPTTPLSARESVRKLEKVVPPKISKKDSTLTPRLKVNRENRQPPHLDSNASVFWLYDECLPDITDVSFDCEMQQSVNSPGDDQPAGVIPTTDISPKPTFESNMEHVAMLNLDEATKKNTTTQNVNEEPNSPTTECVLADQDSLPSGKKAKTCATSGNNNIITMMSETSLIGGHHNTVNGKPQSNSTITMLESSSCDAHPPQSNSTLTLSEKISSDDQHNSFDGNPPQSSSMITNNSSDGHQNTFDSKSSSQSNSTIAMSDSSSSDGHHNTFNTNPPSKTNGTITMSDISSSDSHHNLSHPPSQTNSTRITSESSSSDGQHNILDANPPSQPNSTVNMPESHSFECHQNTCDTIPPHSGCIITNSCSDGKRITFDANPPQSGTTIINSSRDGHHNILDANPPSQTNGTITMSESSSTDVHHNTFDANPPQSGSTITNSSSCGHHGAFNANPLSQTNSAITNSQSNSSDSTHNTFDADPPQLNGTLPVLESGSSKNHHNTFDAKPPSQSNGTITMSEKNSRDDQHNTFDANPPQLNGTLPVSERGSNKNHHNTFDGKPPSQSNGTIAMSEKNSSDDQHNTFDANPPYLSGTIPVSDSRSSNNHNNIFGDKPQSTGTITVSEKNSSGDCSNDKVLESLQGTFEANPGKEFLPSTQYEAKDPSESVPADQSVDTILNSKAQSLNLDDTLDLKSEALITSTPMTSCKMFTFADRDKGKSLVAPKSLYGDAASKPAVQANTSNVPSNIICDRKTILSAKSLLPAFKTATQLLKFKPASLLPGQGEMIGSGLPMIRQRTTAEALSARTLQEGSVVSSSYNLRASTTASKLPKSGLERPQLSARPSSLPKVAPLTRPPPTRSSTLASSSAASNAAVKIPQTRKHNLARDEPVVKKKTKMDVPKSSSHTVASTSSEGAINSARTLRQSANCQRAVVAKGQKDDAAVSTRSAATSAASEAASRTKSIKMPVTNQRPLLAKGHGCANCIVLERELKRLKEELQKYKKEDYM